MSVLKIRDSKTNAFVDVPVIKGQDGKSLEYKWEGTKLGIRQEGEEEYSYSDFVTPTVSIAQTSRETVISITDSTGVKSGSIVYGTSAPTSTDLSTSTGGIDEATQIKVTPITSISAATEGTGVTAYTYDESTGEYHVEINPGDTNAGFFFRKIFPDFTVGDLRGKKLFIKATVDTDSSATFPLTVNYMINNGVGSYAPSAYPVDTGLYVSKSGTYEIDFDTLFADATYASYYEDDSAVVGILERYIHTHGGDATASDSLTASLNYTSTLYYGEPESSSSVTLTNLDNHDMEIVAWGDSLTSWATWTDILASKTGLPVYNAGQTGDFVHSIAARQMADPIMINNITIPSDTSTVVLGTMAELGGLTTFTGSVTNFICGNGLGLASVNPVSISGIEGTLAWTGANNTDTNGTWTFTRTTAGLETVINRPTPIVTNYGKNHNHPYLMTIFMGQNGGVESTEELIDVTRLMINKANPSHYIVIGLISGTDSTVKFGTDTMLQYESKMRYAFGQNFVSLRNYLAYPIKDADGNIISSYGLEDAGMTATSEDLEAIKVGKCPPQLLRSDGVHISDELSPVVANYLFKCCQELGIF